MELKLIGSNYEYRFSQNICHTIDSSVGPKPINALGYCARTLNDKRLVLY
jgi:hypothetical protein